MEGVVSLFDSRGGLAIYIHQGSGANMYGRVLGGCMMYDYLKNYLYARYINKDILYSSSVPLDNTLFPAIDLCGKGALEKENESRLFRHLPIAQQAGTSLITVEGNLRLDHGFDFTFARSLHQ